MQDIYNPENFTPYLYHAPENSGTGLPFIIRASQMCIRDSSMLRRMHLKKRELYLTVSLPSSAARP